jgi:hypothetical protein
MVITVHPSIHPSINPSIHSLSIHRSIQEWMANRDRRWSEWCSFYNVRTISIDVKEEEDPTFRIKKSFMWLDISNSAFGRLDFLSSGRSTGIDNAHTFSPIHSLWDDASFGRIFERDEPSVHTVIRSCSKETIKVLYISVVHIPHLSHSPPAFHRLQRAWRLRIIAWYIA